MESLRRISGRKFFNRNGGKKEKGKGKGEGKGERKKRKISAPGEPSHQKRKKK